MFLLPLLLKRGNFCDFLFIYLDGNPSKKGIEAVHVRLDFTKLCSFFCCHPGVKSPAPD